MVHGWLGLVLPLCALPLATLDWFCSAGCLFTPWFPCGGTNCLPHRHTLHFRAYSCLGSYTLYTDLAAHYAHYRHTSAHLSDLWRLPWRAVGATGGCTLCVKRKKRKTHATCFNPSPRGMDMTAPLPLPYLLHSQHHYRHSATFYFFFLPPHTLPCHLHCFTHTQCPLHHTSSTAPPLQCHTLPVHLHLSHPLQFLLPHWHT